MKKMLLWLLSALTATTSMSAQVTALKIQLPAQAFWISNHWQNKQAKYTQPPQWRSMQDYPKTADINTMGMETLLMSGSAPLSLANMLWLKKNYGSEHPLYIIDLRQETHIYINTLPISIFYQKDQINWGKTSKQIRQQEYVWVKELEHNQLKLYKLGQPVAGFKTGVEPVLLQVNEAATELQTVDQAGISYFRINVPDYHPPSPQQVDEFLNFIHILPKNAWLHFHCAGGKGRTTTFMVMRDILANATRVSLDDIIARQALLGGSNLSTTSKSVHSQPWKNEYQLARIQFLKLFYSYIRSQDYRSQSFSQWMDKQPEGQYKSLMNTKAY